jgi:hypothetical protein
VADENGPRYVARSIPSVDGKPGSPHYNPFGSLRMTSIKDIAEEN